MKIDTEILPVSVEIDGRVYPVAAKTITNANLLSKIATEDANKPRYEVWLQQLRVILGESAVATLFPAGVQENLDRMEAIYAGVMAAFDYNGKRLREQREQAERENLHDLAFTLSTIADKAHEINCKYPGIARPKES